MNKKMTATEKAFMVSMLTALENDRVDLQDQLNALDQKIRRWKQVLLENE